MGRIKQICQKALKQTLPLGWRCGQFLLKINTYKQTSILIKKTPRKAEIGARPK